MSALSIDYQRIAFNTLVAALPVAPTLELEMLAFWSERQGGVLHVQHGDLVLEVTTKEVRILKDGQVIRYLTLASFEENPMEMETVQHVVGQFASRINQERFLRRAAQVAVTRISTHQMRWDAMSRN